MTTPTPDDFLMGSGVPSAKFPVVGTRYRGKITEEPSVRQQIDFASKKEKFYDDGKPMNHLVITIQTELRDPAIENDDGRRRVYVKPGQPKNALADAVRASGAPGLRIGGDLDTQYIGEGEATKGNPPKHFAFAYVPPVSAAANGFLGGTPATTTTVTQNITTPPAATAPATTAVAAPAQFTPEQLAAMQATGVDISKLATPASV